MATNQTPQRVVKPTSTRPPATKKAPVSGSKVTGYTKGASDHGSEVAASTSNPVPTAQYEKFSQGK